MFYTVKIPKIIKIFTPSLVYNIKSSEKIVYLTFDDGPTPEITPKVLKILSQFNVKATFFCLGKNIEANKDVFHTIKKEGHAIGNHSYNHLNGWQTNNKNYFEDIDKANELLNTNIFRPPYGKITPTQIMYLKQSYKIVMWDILSGDFDPNITVKTCVNNVFNNIKPGSIIVFHDTLKAKDTLLDALPIILGGLIKQKYIFEVIERNTLIPE